jgi:hypothetical protein
MGLLRCGRHPQPQPLTATGGRAGEINPTAVPKNEIRNEPEKTITTSYDTLTLENTLD